MPEHEEISRFVTAVFHAWQKAGVNFLVLRNYENLPHAISNDIDVLTTKAQAKGAESVLIQTATEIGFRLNNRGEFATLALYFSDPQTGAQVHFDLFTALKWRGFEFLPAGEILHRKISRGDFFIPHPAHEACVSLLASFIFTGRIKDKYRAKIAAGFRSEPSTAHALFAGFYGETLARHFVESGARENWTGIESKISETRKTLVLGQAIRQPLKTFLSLDADCDRLLKRLFFPPGLVVALCGPDGCGKSTIGRKLTENLRGTFSERTMRHIHWKPRVFSKSRDTGKPETNPHSRPVRNIFLSLACFVFHWAEFFLGWFAKILPVTFKSGLVVIDRYYYDFFVDQKRYRLRMPQTLVRLGYALLPKPDLVFLLDAPPEVLQLRKQEVPLTETARQRNAFLEIIKPLKNGRVIDATKAPEEVAKDIQHAVLDFMAERAKKRNG